MKHWQYVYVVDWATGERYYMGVHEWLDVVPPSKIPWVVSYANQRTRERGRTRKMIYIIT